MNSFYFGRGTRAPRIDRQRVMTRTAASISRHDQPDVLLAKSAFPYISHAPGRQAIQPATPISTKRTQIRFCGNNYAPEPATSRKAIGTAAAPAFGPETFPAALALSSLKTFRPKPCVRAVPATKGPARTRENKASGDWKGHFAIHGTFRIKTQLRTRKSDPNSFQ
jgi:hypothetical protein